MEREKEKKKEKKEENSLLSISVFSHTTALKIKKSNSLANFLIQHS